MMLLVKLEKLLEILINNDKSENKIPNGFRGLIPSDTKINSLNFDNNVIKVDFSKELLDVDIKYEEKVVEAIVYTLTSIKDVDKVILYVDGEILTKLPKSGLNLPSTLDKSYGINKEYDLTTYKDVNQVTIYYVNKYNDQTYYIPVTKYLNDDREKIKIIIEELASSSSYSSNLMSYLNSNTELLATKQDMDSLFLTFNEYIFNDINEKNILEEVIYTISLSVEANYDVKEVVFQVDNQEIYKSVIKTIENS
ncbi:MAG: GerMN domain-containing protein [Bacilli bacterium]